MITNGLWSTVIAPALLVGLAGLAVLWARQQAHAFDRRWGHTYAEDDQSTNSERR